MKRGFKTVWRMRSRILAAASFLMTGLGLAAPAAAQRSPVRFQHHKIAVDTGAHDGRAGGTYEAFRQVVRFAGAPWMRLQVADFELGQGSYLWLRPLADPARAQGEVYQRLDGRSLVQWQNKTALFNGDAVEIQLHVAPGDKGVFARFDEALEGVWDPPAQTRSLCGADNRVASTDNRVGRLYFGGCTAWRITSGAFLSAGHCVDFDPDDTPTQCNPGVPDLVLDLNGFVEFNIPASTAGGATVAAAPNDQYAVDTTPAFWRFDGGCTGLGKDWAVFGVFPNANTGLWPHEAYGFPFRTTRENPASGATIRITGCGSDTGTQNFTLQTDTGPYIDESQGNVAADLEHEYQTDTTGGSSGSPVIWESNGLTIGIHTNAGCDNPVQSDGNHGTSFEVDALEEALKDWVDTTDTKFVDVGHPLRVAESGTIYRPYSTVTLGVTNVLDNGTVSIVTGSYTAAAGNVFTAGTGNKAMMLVAPVGVVTIGN
jgi:hypothetical protein